MADRPPGPRRWPGSAIVVVAAQSILVGLLVLMNVRHLWLTDRTASAETWGSMADWAGVLVAAVGIPVAALFAVRQLRVAQDEADARHHADAVRVGGQLRLGVTPVNLLDRPDLATADELDGVRQLHRELLQRSWRPSTRDGRTVWSRNASTLTTDELLTEHPSALLPRPWVIELVIDNRGSLPVEVEQLTVELAGARVTGPHAAAIAANDRWSHRLEPGRCCYDSTRSAAQEAAGVNLVLDAVSPLGDHIHLEHPGRPPAPAPDHRAGAPA